MIVLNNKFNIADLVYLKTDPEQYEWIVVQIVVMLNNQYKYVCRLAEMTCDFEEFEMTAEKIKQIL